jgi:ABC-type Mn2+/Zn2+ transport system permease subunit
MGESLIQLLHAFPWALAAGLLIASVCALLGVFVILKRVVFIGITLAEVAACGIALAMLVGVPALAGAMTLTLATVGLLALPFESQRIPRDAVLGVLFVGASSLSVLLVSHSGLGLHEVKALLYGDLILTSGQDLGVIAALLLPAAAYLLLFLRPTLYAFLDREAATVLGVRPVRWELGFFLLLGLVVAAASKVAGALLVFCYLVVPAATALLLSRRLGFVLALAVLAGAFSTLVGMAVSFATDLPTNQTIVAVTCLGFLLTGMGVAVGHYGVRRVRSGPAESQVPAGRARASAENHPRGAGSGAAGSRPPEH